MPQSGHGIAVRPLERPAGQGRGTAGGHRPIELHAQLTPDAVAIDAGTRRLTYAELDARADALAVRLRDLGVGRDVLVGLFATRSAEAVVGMLGILKAGGAFVPFDPSYPTARLAFMLRDARPSVVVAQAALAGELPVGPGQVVPLDADAAVRPSDRTVDVTHRPEDLAYAIYTSGSTGRPKAALLTHRGLGYLLSGMTETVRLTPAGRVMQTAPLGFDAAVFEIFGALAAGATLCVAEPERLAPGPRLAETLRAMRATVAVLPPTVLALLPEADLPDLGLIVVAGERCPAEVASRWSTGRRFLNAYGPTEGTVCATVYECPHGPQPAPPIGSPLPDCEAIVLDESLRPVPDGEPGELHLGGPGLARGYLRRRRLTAEKFLPHPFSAEPGARLYKTGDLVRRRADGALEFLGRTDDQVKVRGVRVELGEVAAALERHPAVAAAAVLAEEDAVGGRRLVAYVARQPDRRLVVRDLIGHLRESLPLAMLPSAIVPLDLDRWPLLPSGKVDRRALPAAAEAARSTVDVDADRPRVAARDGLEYQIAQVWEEVLDGRPVGVTDDFFEAGGDSLGAIDLIARLERRLGRAVPMSAFLERPTVEGLAGVLRRTGAAAASPLVPLRATGIRRPLFCVPPGGGGVLCYVELTRALGSDQPVYAIQAAGIDDERTPLDRVERMAEDYVAAIRAVRPDGPYDLCGWSFGGVVAYEMARLLEAAGETVSCLALIDTGLMYSFAVLRALVPRELDFGPLWADRNRQLPQFRGFAERVGIIPPGANETQAGRGFEVFMANVGALMEYRPDPYGGTATLFKAEKAIVPAKYDAAREWGRLCAAVDVEPVPGDHLTMLGPPHVATLAERLAARLKEGAGSGE